MPTRNPNENKPSWTFLTNHFHVLVVLSRDPAARIRDISDEVGITQRAVQRIIAEMVVDSILSVEKMGRRNSYHINRSTPLKHALENKHSVGELLKLLS